MRKRVDLATVIIFFIALSLPVTAMIFGGATDSYERRSPAAFPSFMQNGRFNTQFFNEFDDYFSDRFGLRPQLITAYAALNYRLLNHSVNDQVIAGKKGWLFFDQTIDDYTNTRVLSDFELEKITVTLALQQHMLAKRDIDFVFMPVPNKNTLYPEYMPNRYIQRDKPSNYEALIDVLFRHEVTFIDLFTLFSTVKDYEVYHKRDTHWNNLGAMIAKQALLDVMDDRSYDDVFYRLPAFEIKKDFFGDLSRMLMPRGRVMENEFHFETQGEFRYVRPIRTMEDMRIETVNEQGRFRLFMFRDSFANNLIPYLSKTFETALYTRSVPLDYRLLDTEAFDMVVYQIVERNFSDIMRSAPMLLSSPMSMHIEHVKKGNPLELTMDVTVAHGMQKIQGQIASLASNYIYLQLGDQFYQAFPVAEQAIEDKTVFTIYLEEDVDVSQMTILIKTDAGFIKYEWRT